MEYQANKPERAALGSYSDDSLLKPRHFYKTGFEDTLENIVAGGTPAPEQSFLDRVLDDKKQVLKATVKALFNEMQEREKLSSTMIQRINGRILDSYTYLHEIRDITSRTYSLDLALNLSRRRTQLEDRILSLEKLRDEEAVACLRDGVLTRRYLLQGLSAYWEFARKTEHLGYGEHVER